MLTEAVRVSGTGARRAHRWRGSTPSEGARPISSARSTDDVRRGLNAHGHAPASGSSSGTPAPLGRRAHGLLRDPRTPRRRVRTHRTPLVCEAASSPWPNVERRGTRWDRRGPITFLRGLPVRIPPAAKGTPSAPRRPAQVASGSTSAAPHPVRHVLLGAATGRNFHGAPWSPGQIGPRLPQQEPGEWRMFGRTDFRARLPGSSPDSRAPRRRFTNERRRWRAVIRNGRPPSAPAMGERASSTSRAPGDLFGRRLSPRLRAGPLSRRTAPGSGGAPRRRKVISHFGARPQIHLAELAAEHGFRF